MKTALQKFGKFLSAMVMPNIGAFIAWGFITALFIADGWLPNEQLASIQPYMLTYLLPILIAASGGKMIAKERGQVMGAIAVVGCIAGVGGTEGQPMLMAAMIIGPFAGWVIKKFDQIVEGHIPADCDVMVVQSVLAERAQACAPQAKLITIGNFLADPALDDLFFQLSTGNARVVEVQEPEEKEVSVSKDILTLDGIQLNLKSVSKEEAIIAAGKQLVKLGYVEEYITAMLEREKIVTTYIGMGLAIPHGTTHEGDIIHKTGIVLLQYPDGIDFGDEKAQLVIGIAGMGGEHMEVLAKVCTALEDEAILEKMKTIDDKEWILKQLS